MTQTYRGYHIISEPHYGDNAEQHAWDDFLGRLADRIRCCPATSRFIWRVVPYVEQEREFERNDVAHRVYSRIVEVIGDGELPHLDRGLKFEDSLLATGFGLAP